MSITAAIKPMHRLILFAFTALGGGSSCSYNSETTHPKDAETQAQEAKRANELATASTIGGGVSRVNPVNRSEIDEIMLAFQGKRLEGKKKKDAVPGSIKVNLYQDKDIGSTQINRAKVDLDRDERWDQKWFYKTDGTIEVKISTEDNTKYDMSKTWAKGKWVEKDGKPKREIRIADDATTTDLSESIMLRFQGQSLPKAKKKDAYKGPFKVNLYQDTGNPQINRAKIDLDRDGKWDQLWTYLDDGSITVKMSFLDNEQYDESKQWKDGAWIE